MDERERSALSRALAELGHDPSEFEVVIAPILLEGGGGRALGRKPRKEVVVTRQDGSSFRLETYCDGAWAGEILLAVMGGKLG